MVSVSNAIGRSLLPSSSKRQLTRAGLPTVAKPASSHPKYFAVPVSCATSPAGETKQIIESNKHPATSVLSKGEACVNILPAARPREKRPRANSPRKYHLLLCSLICSGKTLLAFFPSAVKTSTVSRYSPLIGNRYFHSVL